jgi:hypothetical protein
VTAAGVLPDVDVIVFVQDRILQDFNRLGK